MAKGWNWKRAAGVACVGAAAVGLVVASWSSEAEAKEDSSSESASREGGGEEGGDGERSRADSASVDRLAERRDAINRGGMGTLIGWAVANIGVGAVGWATTEGRWRAFHQMNVAWNAVNLGIGIAGYLGSSGASEPPGGPVDALDESRGIQQILLLNAGLDVAYVAGGGWLREVGRSRDEPSFVGWGEGMMVQGAFLLGLDAVLWSLHQSAVGDFRARLFPGVVDSRPAAVLSVDF